MPLLATTDLIQLELMVPLDPNDRHHIESAIPRKLGRMREFKEECGQQITGEIMELRGSLSATLMADLVEKTGLKIDDISKQLSERINRVIDRLATIRSLTPEEESVFFDELWKIWKGDKNDPERKKEILMLNLNDIRESEIDRCLPKVTLTDPKENPASMDFQILKQIQRIIPHLKQRILTPDGEHNFHFHQSPIGFFVKALKELKSFLKEQFNAVPDSQNNAEIKTRMNCLESILKILFENPGMKFLEGSSVTDMLKIAVQMAFTNDFNTTISIGIGGTKDELNARIPSYTVAATTMVENFIKLQNEMSKKGIRINVPTLRIFSAHHIAIIANGFPHEQTHRNGLTILKFIESYLREFHPQVLDHTRLEHDTQELYETPEIIAAGVKLDSMEQSGHINGALDKLRARGLRRSNGGKDRTGFYASTHAVAFEDIAPKNRRNRGFIPTHAGHSTREMEKVPDAVITLGGQREIEFNRVRRLLVDGVADDPSIRELFELPLCARTITVACESPGYYHHESGDLTVNEVHEGRMDSHLPRQVHNDLKIIMQDIARSRGISDEVAWEVFTDFVKSFTTAVEPEGVEQRTV